MNDCGWTALLMAAELLETVTVTPRRASLRSAILKALLNQSLLYKKTDDCSFFAVTPYVVDRLYAEFTLFVSHQKH